MEEGFTQGCAKCHKRSTFPSVCTLRQTDNLRPVTTVTVEEVVPPTEGSSRRRKGPLRLFDDSTVGVLISKYLIVGFPEDHGRGD